MQRVLTFKPPAVPFTSIQPDGEGLKVIGFHTLGAAVGLVLGHLIYRNHGLPQVAIRLLVVAPTT